MNEIPLEYWNRLASQLIVICSLLSGFSIAITANLLVYKSDNRITISILKSTTVAAGCFLVTVFAMTKIVMITTQGYPGNANESILTIPRLIGISTFLIGITSLSVVIALAGWTKSRNTGIFTTIVGVLTFLMILVTLIEIRM